MEQKIHSPIRKKIGAFIIIFALLAALCPQLSFAADATLTWRTASGGTAGSSASATLRYSGISGENIAFRSSNEEVLSSDGIWINRDTGSQMQIKYVASKGGTTTITAYDKTDDTVFATTSELTFKDYQPTTYTVYLGAGDESARTSLPTGAEVPGKTYEYTIEDEDIAVIEENQIVGKSLGTTTGHILCEELGVDWEFTVEVKEDPSGFYYNDEKVTELEWDKSDGDLQLTKVIDLTYTVASDIMDEGFYDFSNTEVAEMEYIPPSTSYEEPDPTGKILFKKNGTVTIKAYRSVNRTKVVGTLTIKVTGFDEDAPLANWEGVSGPQSYATGNSAASVELLNYDIEKNTLNDAIFQGQIINHHFNVNNATLSVKIGASNPDTDFDLDAYLERTMPLINVYEMQEDGTHGKLVASYEEGYTLLRDNVETTMGSSGSGDGVSYVTLPIRIDSDVLEKGKTYALYLDNTIQAPCGMTTGANLTATLIKDFEFQFPTMGGAKTIELDRTTASIKPGESLTLTATMNKNESVEADDTVSWKSSDPSIATVDNSGVVTAKKPGNVTITATAVDGKVSAECKITVEAIKSTDITLSSRAATLYVGKTLTLKATVYPTDATDKTVTWSSSNSKVASVDKNGKVTAKKAGTAVITAKTADGLSTSATITVKNVKVTGVKLNAKKVTRTVGKTKQLKATVRPSNATNKGVTWTSSNKRVATVTSKGKVRAKSPGKATITVKTKDGKYKAKAVITVKPKNTSFTLKGNASSVVVKYKKRAGIDGYQIYRSEKKKGGYERVTTRTKKKGGQYTSVGVRANRTYYYKMRTYKVVKGKKIYSTFSAAKKVRTR